MGYTRSEVSTVLSMGAAILIALPACGGGSSSSKPGGLAPPNALSATADLTGVTVNWPDVTGATSYNLYFDTSSGVTKATGNQIPGAAPPYFHTGLTPGVTYYYVVTSLRNSREGAESMEASATFTGPPAPTGVTATARSRRVTIDWGFVPVATGHNLYWDTNPGVTAATGNQVPGVTPPFDHTSLTNGTTYYYVLTSLSGAVEGVESTEVSATPDLPPPPSGVTATAGDTQVTIDWQSVPVATGYNLYWDTNPGVTAATGNQVAGVTAPFDHTSLTNGTPHYYVLTSLDGADEGPESVEVNATPNPLVVPSGALDTSFGGQGWVTHNDAAGANWVDEGYGVSIDSLGRILVTGYSMTPTNHLAMVIWRLNDDGTLDTTFNNQGWVVFDGGGGPAAIDEGWSVIEDSSGRIVVVGTYGVNSLDQDMAIWRYLGDGTPDTTFGNNGLASHDGAAGMVGGEDYGWAGFLDSTGRIVVGGSSPNTRGDWDMVIWRYLETGAIDTTFGTGGYFVHDSAAGGIDWDEALNITEDPAGRIVATGYSVNILGDVDMVTWRVHATGVLDTTFGGGSGYVLHHGAAGGDSEDYGEGIVALSSRILVSGISTNLAGNFDMAIWAYDNQGNLDPTFGNGGVVVHGNSAGGNGWDDGLSVAIDRFSRCFVTGFSIGPRFDRDMIVWGYDSLGILDPAFANAGLFIGDNAGGGMGDDTANALVIDPQDRIVAVGSTWTPTAADDMVVWRIR